MNKKKLIEYFKKGGKSRVITPGHKYYGVDREAEKIQTNSLRFKGGSWLYFKDITLILSQGFKINDTQGGFIDYAYCDMDLIKEIEGQLVMFKVIYDNGKPWTQAYSSIKFLEEGLKEFYEQNRNNDYPFNAIVENSIGEDITESHLINSLVGNILNDEVIELEKKEGGLNEGQIKN